MLCIHQQTEVPDGAYLDTYHQYLLDISSFERNTDEQDMALLHQLELVKCGALSRRAGEQVVQRLIEGSLYRVMCIARNYHQHLLAVSGGRTSVSLMDLIQTGNEALVKCAYHCLNSEETSLNFGAYTGSSVSGTLKTYRIQDCPVSVSVHDWYKAAQEEKLPDLYEVVSLDTTPLEDGNEYPLAERLVAPTPTPIHPDKQQKVVMLLQTLSEQEQRIVRLRYGLDPDDQHEHTYEEIADLLGSHKGVCYRREQRLIQTLREQAPLRNSPDYYSASEAAHVLGICPSALPSRVKKEIIQRYYPVGCDFSGVYSKAQIDGLAEYCRQITQDYYTMQEAMACLGVSNVTIKNWVQAGKLTKYQFPEQGDCYGRYLKTEIDALAQQSQPIQLHPVPSAPEPMYA